MNNDIVTCPGDILWPGVRSSRLFLLSVSS